MTTDILIVLVILGVAIVLFISERVRVDVVALMVLVSLALTGLVSPTEALSGFSNVAVVTVWAVLILSGGLARTGVANLLGQRILRLAGRGEIRLIIIIMLAAGVLSGFMNVTGVVALMLPVVLDIARRTSVAPSRLLMPLSFAALLGGLTTLIGTPPNILVSEALQDAGLQPFRMFDYTPVGVAVLGCGLIFMATVGRRLLPKRDIAQELVGARHPNLAETFHLEERLFVLTLPPGSQLAGLTVAESRLGSALGVNLIGIFREAGPELAPGPDAILKAGDHLLVTGRQDRMQELRGREQLVLEAADLGGESLVSSDVALAEVRLGQKPPFLGKTLDEIGFRGEYGINVLAVWRAGRPLRARLRGVALQSDDVLLVQGSQDRIRHLEADPDLFVSEVGDLARYRLNERLFTVQIPETSTLAGKSLGESRIADAFGLTVLGIARDGETRLMPTAAERLEAGDTVMVEGRPDDLRTLRGLEGLEIEPPERVGLGQLETDQIGLSEVVLAPHTTLVGKTLRQIRFREKYGLSVIAIWRGDQAFRSNLGHMTLKFGDALLLYGHKRNLSVLATDRDFLVLTQGIQEPPKTKKAPLALLIMAAVLLPVILGWVSIGISAIMGVVLMILTGCLSMEEAYHSIEWKAIFLIAGMLPLGIALDRTGAAALMARGMVDLVGGLGPLGVLAGLFIMAALASQVMPNPAVAVLLAPIALSAAAGLGVSPYPLMMTVAVSASAAFMSPVGHPANVLILGPGGYRLSDYVKVGAPLTLAVLITVLIVVPLAWPF